MNVDRRKLDFIILFIAISCKAHDESKFISDREPMWRNIVNLTECDQTFFLDIDNASSVIFKNSVLKSLYSLQSVVVLTEAGIPKTTCFRNFGCSDEALRRVMRTDLDIVVTMNSLDSKILDTPILVLILKPGPWSALFIIVTTKDSLYKCDQGKLNEEAMHNIENFLNELWHKHRTINVFLNLPYVCPNKYVVYNSTKLTDRALYNRTIELVQTNEQILEAMAKKRAKTLTQNYPLRGNIFYRFPTAIQDCAGTDIYIKTRQKYSGGFCGLDGLIMSDIVTHFQFNLSLPILSPGYDKYGYQMEDGNVTGSLGHIVNKHIDISFNSRFMTKYTSGIQQYKYLYYVANDALCAIVNQPKEEPLWQYPINSYSIKQWLFIIGCLTSIGICMWISAKITNKTYYSNASTFTLGSYILNSLNAGLFGFFLKRRKDLLFLRAACLFASIIVLAKYQSYINYIFTTRVRYDMISTLSDLVEEGTVIQISPSIYHFINESIDDVSLALLSKTIVLDNVDSYDYVRHHQNSATLDRQIDAIMLTLKKYMDGAGRPLLYVVNECFRVFFLSYIANLEFPFVDTVRVYMMRLVETGLLNMYYSWTSRALGLEMTLPNLYAEPRPVAKVTISEQVIAFSLLLVGYALSVVAFVVEVWMDRRRTYPFLA